MSEEPIVQVGHPRLPIVRRRPEPSRALGVAFGDGLRPPSTELGRESPVLVAIGKTALAGRLKSLVLLYGS